jgi:hypothetical protein
MHSDIAERDLPAGRLETQGVGGRTRSQSASASASAPCGARRRTDRRTGRNGTGSCLPSEALRSVRPRSASRAAVARRARPHDARRGAGANARSGADRRRRQARLLRPDERRRSILPCVRCGLGTWPLRVPSLLDGEPGGSAAVGRAAHRSVRRSHKGTPGSARRRLSRVTGSWRMGSPESPGSTRISESSTLCGPPIMFSSFPSRAAIRWQSWPTTRPESKSSGDLSSRECIAEDPVRPKAARPARRDRPSAERPLAYPPARAS